MSQKVEGCLFQLKQQSNAELPKDDWKSLWDGWLLSSTRSGIQNLYYRCGLSMASPILVSTVFWSILTNFYLKPPNPKTTTDWNPSLWSTSVVVYRCALPSPSMQGHTMQLQHWAIAGWGLVARTRRLRGNRLHYWMVAMNRELRCCNNWSGQRLAWGDGNVDRCTQCHQARFNLKFRQRGKTIRRELMLHSHHELLVVLLLMLLVLLVLLAL